MGYKLKLIQPKQNQKQINHESNKLCMFQTGKKNPTRCVKKNKNNIINTIGDKFAMSIR